MSGKLNLTSDIEIGERLRVAREKAGKTQVEAAKLIDVARTTLVAIEQGKRPSKLTEVQALANAYGTTANAIYRSESVQVDFIPQFRRVLHTSSEASIEAAHQLQELVAAEVELESALGIVRRRSYPAETPLLPGDVVDQAEHDANELRRFLGLGSGPLVDLVGLLEMQLGIRIYMRPLAPKVSGLFAFDDNAGACMLLNSNHPTERLRNSAAHETGHFMGTRRTPEIDAEDGRFLSREEKYANAFAPALLMPAPSVKRLFTEVTSGQSHFTRRHIILMAQTFGVSRESLVRRLENLKLVRPRTWDWFEDNGGITAEQVAEVIGDRSTNFEPSLRLTGLLPRRLSLLAIEAYKRGIYSEGQLTHLLGVSRYELRTILDDAEDEMAEEDDFVKISH
jgi:Zn-dependent peptidase ImmA (M78 family)/DNA-binding XRE family transcriptional regulator